MGGRETDDDDTIERHTDTHHKLTRHTASWRYGIRGDRGEYAEIEGDTGR